MAEPQPREIEFRTSDGLTLRGDIWGDENVSTVVLSHGGGQTRRSWRRGAATLVESGFRVLTYDARGHGDSDWSPVADYSLPALAADLLTVRESVAGPLVLVGASMGGMSSLYAAGTNTARIAEALVLVDIVPRINKAGGNRIIKFMTSHLDGFESVDEAVAAVSDYSRHRRTPADAANLSHNLRRRDDGRLYWHWDPHILDDRSAPEATSLLDQTDFDGRLVDVPVLLVRGEKSDLIDEAGIAELRTMVPHLEQRTVLNAGHMVAGDDNSKFQTAILPFIRRNLISSASSA